jgi:multidrug efflux pump
VIGGMLTATFVATFMIPMFFVLISRFAARPHSADAPTEPAAAAAPAVLPPAALTGVH